ncbi:beta-1,4-mannosyltransferase egh-like [Gigantopelta aegis]|uniref:beta-1,4-mannosyltransferase egh-like n=1 Tax=Gigantopelta aegis TaxID=1735272 RepID=UPI001B889C3C|nr:beta-1,4-mannosyltransferase egh-like [Gigantopelta aegis]
MGLQRYTQHSLCVGLLFLIIYGYYILLAGDGNAFDPYVRYGRILTWAMYIPRICTYFVLTFAFGNLLGIVCFNTFPESPRLKKSPLLIPFVCFRVVTRGLFPELVKDNIDRNIGLCETVGLQHFMFEVVTDMPINLAKNRRLREIVVPHNYSTSQGSLYKARALQYCLEPEINCLGNNDWIVHLDEETVLTEDSIVGIVNFIAEGKHHFGQGSIVYTKDKIVNWITTLIDSVRVGVDYGVLRFCLKALNRPFFSWKGSFIVANAAAEMDVSFNHGPEASVAEDSFFAMMATTKGYTFGFVDGEMWERSTFSMMDFLRQRRRWLLGIIMAALSSKIPIRHKVGLILMSISGLTLPIVTFGLFLGFIYPLPSWGGIHPLICSPLGTFLFLYIFGTIKSFSLKRIGYLKFALIIISTIGCAVIAIILESIAAFWVWFSRGQIAFQIVQKDPTRKTMV